MIAAIVPEADAAPERVRPASDRPTIVCLTPMRNEAWMIERFLACTSLWADRIIIADQGSTDGSREIAASHPKVTLIDNPNREFDEQSRQELLIAAARAQVDGPLFLLALDVDEILSANWMDSAEWATMLAAPRGTLVHFQRVELLEFHRAAWLPLWEWPWGFMDDGSQHEGGLIHSDRVPVPKGAPSLLMRDVKVLHYAAADMARLRSRNRWYQCWEVLHRPERRAAALFRHYHMYDGVAPAELTPIDPSWTAGYARCGIDMTSVLREPRFRWDEEVLDMILAQGARAFRRVDVWGTDWRAVGAQWHRDVPEQAVRDPRTIGDRIAYKWLWATQRRRESVFTRMGDAALRLLGW